MHLRSTLKLTLAVSLFLTHVASADVPSPRYYTNSLPPGAFDIFAFDGGVEYKVKLPSGEVKTERVIIVIEKAKSKDQSEWEEGQSYLEHLGITEAFRKIWDVITEKVRSLYSDDIVAAKAEANIAQMPSKPLPAPADPNCPTNVPLKPFIKKAPTWNPAAKTFKVRGTEFGGPFDTVNDVVRIKDHEPKKLTVPNRNAYTGRDWIPQGLDRNLCECALPADVQGSWLLVRVGKKTVHCKVTDKGPKTTKDPYWVGKKPQEIKPQYPNRAIDLTSACWDALGVQGKIGTRSGDLEWQFTSPPPGPDPESLVSNLAQPEVAVMPLVTQDNQFVYRTVGKKKVKETITTLVPTSRANLGPFQWKTYKYPSTEKPANYYPKLD